jgi:predicted NUDIX family phosphoesterase
MSNLALAVSHHELVHHPVPGNFTTFLVDRAVFDDKTFVVPGVKQFLPYITFYSKSRQEVLTYARGKAGTEVRLRGRSVGFGGHVETKPAADTSGPDGYRILGSHLAMDAMREIEEELPGFAADAREDLFQYLQSCLTEPAGIVHRAIDIRFAPVDCVHLGISLIVNIDQFPGLAPEMLEGEANQVVDLKWVSLADLAPPMQSGEDLPDESRLYEGWSQFVLMLLTNDGRFGKYLNRHEDLVQRIVPAMDSQRYL